MKRRIFKDMLLLSFVTILITSVFICGVLYRHAFMDMKQEIQDKASYISALFNDDLLDFTTFLQYFDDIGRITLIAADGRVLFDNTTEAALMANHLHRSEVEYALRQGAGESIRLSETMGQQTYYYATRLNDYTILRVAFTTDTVFTVFLSILPMIGLTAFIVFGISLVMAKRQAGKLVAPINTIDFDSLAESNIYDELSPFLDRIRQLRCNLDQQVAQAKENQEQFTVITGNMVEGLVILDNKGVILSVNASAIQLLKADSINYTGMHILSLNRSMELQRMIKKVLNGSHVKKNITQEDKIVRIWANPVYKDDAIHGAILILLDVTESQTMEDFRREFSANVSHELKTPLTVISGLAELLRNGLVKAEDIPSFSDKMFNEAQRMVKLVNDIIIISRLDENAVKIPMEKVDLLAAVKCVTERLTDMANKKGISLAVSGEPLVISAVPGLLDELIQNLCDNAIRHNVENGKVEISIFQISGRAVLRVEDTGTGIPSAHQNRVFERFYRVDKSHSRETGGTGLGLSIVKHVALYHHAEIKLESTPGKGTAITVAFPFLQ